MRRRSAFGLAGVGAYGVCLLATGASLALGGMPHGAGAAAADGSVRVELGPVAASAQLGGAGSVAALASVAPANSVAGALPIGRRPSPTGRVASPRSSSSVPTARLGSVGPGQRTSFVPLEIVLPSGSTAPVVEAGVAADGALLIPDNPRQVGYWTGGARPGEQFGNVVIAGHIDSARYGIGVLAGLKGVQAGAVIELRAGAERLRYRVTQSQTVPQQSLATNDQVFRQDGPAGLVVITCGGPFDPVRHRYQDNVIVSAVPVG